jgi:hypothetical protein
MMVVRAGGGSRAEVAEAQQDPVAAVDERSSEQASGSLELDADGDGGRFALRALKTKPYCGGQSVTGELLGCFRK